MKNKQKNNNSNHKCNSF